MIGDSFVGPLLLALSGIGFAMPPDDYLKSGTHWRALGGVAIGAVMVVGAVFWAYHNGGAR